MEYLNFQRKNYIDLCENNTQTEYIPRYSARKPDKKLMCPTFIEAWAAIEKMTNQDKSMSNPTRTLDNNKDVAWGLLGVRAPPPPPRASASCFG